MDDPFPQGSHGVVVWTLFCLWRQGDKRNGLLMLASLGDELREMEKRQEMKQEAESLPQVKEALAPGLSPSCYQ